MFILPSGHLPHTATRMAFGADPCMGRQRTEQLLSYYFGLKTVIRLNGIRNHDITDAHIDFYARCIILLLPTDRHMTPINWQTAAGKRYGTGSHRPGGDQSAIPRAKTGLSADGGRCTGGIPAFRDTAHCYQCTGASDGFL